MGGPSQQNKWIAETGLPIPYYGLAIQPTRTELWFHAMKRRGEPVPARWDPRVLEAVAPEGYAGEKQEWPGDLARETGPNWIPEDDHQWPLAREQGRQWPIPI